MQLGINDGDYVEVKAGIQNGDTIQYTPAAAADLQAMMERRRNNAWAAEAK